MIQQRQEQEKEQQTATVKFAKTSQVKLVPHFSMYSAKQQARIWYTELELEMIKENFELEQRMKEQYLSAIAATGSPRRTRRSTRASISPIRPSRAGSSGSRRSSTSLRTSRSPTRQSRTGSSGSRRSSTSLSPVRRQSEQRVELNDEPPVARTSKRASQIKRFLLKRTL